MPGRARSHASGWSATSPPRSRCRSRSPVRRSTSMPRRSPMPCGATRGRTDGDEARATTASVTSKEEQSSGQQVCRFPQHVRGIPHAGRLTPMRELRMIARRLVVVLACACMTALAPSALATPRCTKTCRRETAACTQTQCRDLVGTARRGCLETCRGIGGCARVRTLAYVVSTCTVHAFHQRLQIRHGDCDPITVLDFPEPVEGLPCEFIGSAHSGQTSSTIVGAFQRIGVSADGRHVVFEVTDDFSPVIASGAAKNLVPPDQREGIFVVRAGGRGLRRLGPASRDPSFRYVAAGNPASPTSVEVNALPSLPFSPDGREVVLTDLGPGTEGEEAIQIFTLDILTGSRIQLTHLPFV